MQKLENQPGNENSNADLQVLFHAISSCAIVPVQQLLTSNPNLLHCKGWNGQTPLHRACLTGDKDLVRYLLDAGADPNTVNNFNETSVHYASKRGIPSLVHLMVKRGGKLDVRDGRGRTPLHNAAEVGSVFMLKYFEEHGFDLKDVDHNQQSPLHIVCLFGHLEAFKFLMRKGRSDPTHQDKDGNTALHICTREGYAHGSWILLNQIGLPCLYIKNKEGFTPLDIARQFESSNKDGHKKLITMFDELARLPPNGTVKGPWILWYMHLLGPAALYLFGLIPALFVVPNHQGIALLAGLAYIVKRTRSTGHRLDHVSRLPSPWFIGMFSAGIFHTMLVYHGHIAFYIEGHQGLYIFSLIANILLLYQYWKLLTMDPGVVTTSILNDKTNEPLTLTNLCETGADLDIFCGECEIVRTKDTKHCKLCDKCCYRMDHHCLFILKCVAHNNHARFVWFLILVAFVMIIFVLEAFYYISIQYPSLSYTEKLQTMFWSDCWVLSMVVLNIGSICWAVILIRYQIIVVAKAQTWYFQQSVTTLTPIEQLLNVIYFLQGKPAFAVDFKFDSADLYPKQKSGDLYPKQPGFYPSQNTIARHCENGCVQDV